jgi:hypothetical protein
LLTENVLKAGKSALMRRFLFVLPLIASAIAMPGSARGVENLNRIFKFAEVTFDTAIQRIKRRPDEPLSVRVVLPAIVLGGGHANRSDKVPARIKLTFQ